MIDLKKASALPIVLEDEGIRSEEGFELPNPDFRKLEDFLFVLDHDSSLTGPEVAYTMFRKTAKPEDVSKYENNNLEYDITVLNAGPVGKEKMKTIGHYHSKKQGTEVAFPEVYEVIYGRAHYIIQKLKEGSETDVEDFKIIEALAGDKVVIPPGYGHITINPTNNTLVESNIQPTINVSDYSPYLSMHGAVFYELENGEFVKNEKYFVEENPVILKAKEINDIFNIQNGIPLYQDYTDNPLKYDFLVNPEKYLDAFSKLS